MHVLAALVEPETAAAVRAVFLRETTLLGVRDPRPAPHPCPGSAPSTSTVSRSPWSWGRPRTGRIVDTMPESGDVARAATVLGRPVEQVLAQALGLAGGFTLSDDPVPDRPGDREIPAGPGWDRG